MSTADDAEAFAQKVLETMGPTETLLMAMRLVLLVGQRTPDNEQVIDAAKEAISAIKRMGALSGTFMPSS